MGFITFLPAMKKREEARRNFVLLRDGRAAAAAAAVSPSALALKNQLETSMPELWWDDWLAKHMACGKVALSEREKHFTAQETACSRKTKEQRRNKN